MPDRQSNTPDDHDSPWKEALELYLPQALALLVQDLYTAINWAVPPVFLEKELQSIDRRSKQGRRFVDKLVRVHLLNGTDLQLLIHIEVQSQLSGANAHANFARRMYEYHYLIQMHDRRIRESDVLISAILVRLQAIQDALQVLTQQQAQSRTAQEQAAEEWRAAPSDEALRTAHALATASMQTHTLAQERLQQATQQLQQADSALTSARQALQQDAADLRLPDTPEELHSIERHLQDFADAVSQLTLAAREQQRAHLEWQQQAAREQRAQPDHLGARRHSGQ